MSVEAIKNYKSKHSLWPTWKTMKRRCYNKKSIDYKYYGGSGIVVCDRWHDFWSFVEDMGNRPSGMTLDRINSKGNYEPSNCKWSTPAEQSKNRRISYECHKGHPWNDETTILSHNGKGNTRRCRLCFNERYTKSQLNRQLKKDKPNDRIKT